MLAYQQLYRASLFSKCHSPRSLALSCPNSHGSERIASLSWSASALRTTFHIRLVWWPMSVRNMYTIYNAVLSTLCYSGYTDVKLCMHTWNRTFKFSRFPCTSRHRFLLDHHHLLILPAHCQRSRILLEETWQALGRNSIFLRARFFGRTASISRSISSNETLTEAQNSLAIWRMLSKSLEIAVISLFTVSTILQVAAYPNL